MKIRTCVIGVMLIAGGLMFLVGCGEEDASLENVPSRRDQTANLWEDLHLYTEARQEGQTVTVSPTHQFEIVVDGTTLRLYGYGEHREHMSLEGVLGRVRIRTSERESEWTPLRFHPAREAFHQEETEEGYLEAHVTGWADLASETAELTFHLSGLRGTDQPMGFRYVHHGPRSKTSSKEPHTGRDQ